MTTESRILKGHVSLPYNWAMGPVTTQFYEQFKQKKIMGTRCAKCDRVLVPARMFCSSCFAKTEEWVEVSQEGTIRTWVLINFSYPGQPKEPPYILGIIDLDGADAGLPHFIGGVDATDLASVEKRVRIGGRVEAVWKDSPEGFITDIEYFRPID
jgi:uncharacterized protein